MSPQENPPPGEKIYVVAWNDAVDQRSEQVAARNAGEAVWLVHARSKDPAGASYTVAPLDETEPARNFTVGRAD